MTGRRRAFLVVCDALQRDYIRNDRTPVIVRLRSQASEFTVARSVFPSMTRVTSASMATGCLPGAHGLVGNSMALDEGHGLMNRSVASPDFIDRMRRATGQALRRKTLAERLASHGGCVVYSNVSAGAAYFQDPDRFGHVFHREGSFAPGGLPVARKDQLAIAVGADGDAQMTQRFCREVVREDGAALGVLWLSEPDESGHTGPLGSPHHVAGLRASDACVGTVLSALDRLGSDDDTLLIVCSDHGMQTIRDEVDLTAKLVEAGLKETPSSTEVVVSPNGTAALIYVAEQTGGLIVKIGEFLKRQSWVGRVMIGDQLGEVGLRPERSLAMAVTAKAFDDVNAFGIRGSSILFVDPYDPENYRGRGMHGGLSDAEQSPFLMIRGAGFPAGTNAGVASPIDIAPTILAHFRLPADGCDGASLQSPTAGD